jgi:hypothetical protein
MTDLTTTPSESLESQTPEKNPSNIGQSGTFGDIDPNYRLSNAQCRAIELALDGFRWSQITHFLDISRKTIWRWKTQNPDFRDALAAARADRHDFAMERCQSLAQRASSVLARFLEDSADKNRMRAAQLLLQAAARFAPPSPKPEPLGATASFHWLDQVLKPIGR